MPSRWHQLFARVSSEQAGSPGLIALRGAARVASMFYGVGAALYHTPYDVGLRKVRRLDAPVIGVGNLVAGGAGKTPLVMAIAAALAEMGREPAVISRGYGGSSKAPVTWAHDGRELLADAAAVGDEPVMVARELGLPVAVGADRWQVGREVLAKLGPRVLVADDLFQHRGLWRDLNLLALDAARPFGNGVVLPRGPLREPARALRRAQAVVLTRAEEPSAVEATRRWLAKFLGPIPVLACRHRVTGVVDHQGRWRPAGELAGRKVAAFCGLARPDSFEASLAGLGLEVVEARRFNDHHAFSAEEVRQAWQKAAAAGAEALVCSQKDAVRLPAEGLDAAPIWVTRLELRFEHHGAELKSLLKQALADWPV